MGHFQIPAPWCQRDSTVGEAPALHTADLTFIPRTLYGSLDTSRNEPGVIIESQVLPPRHPNEIKQNKTCPPAQGLRQETWLRVPPLCAPPWPLFRDLSRVPSMKLLGSAAPWPHTDLSFLFIALLTTSHDTGTMTSYSNTCSLSLILD